MTHKCERCRCEEYIPTHQYVKFEDRISYVCKRCWDGFKRWFHYGAKEGSPWVDNAA